MKSFYFLLILILFQVSSSYAQKLEVDTMYRLHKVLPGQSLYSIARAYGVTVEDIKAANPQINGNDVSLDLILIIP